MADYSVFTGFPRAGFLRRIGAILYDILLLAAVIMVATAIALLAVALIAATPFYSIPAEADHASVLNGNPWYFLWMVSVILWFYVWFWVRGGQTLGMRTWRMRIQNSDGTPITPKQGFIRCFFSFLGLGNFLVIVRKDNLALQDLIAGCEVVILDRETNQFKHLK